MPLVSSKSEVNHTLAFCTRMDFTSFLPFQPFLCHRMLNLSVFQHHCRTIRRFLLSITFSLPHSTPHRQPQTSAVWSSAVSLILICLTSPKGTQTTPAASVQQGGQSCWQNLLSALGGEVVDRCLEDFLSLDQRFICSELFKKQTVCWQE